MLFRSLVGSPVLIATVWGLGIRPDRRRLCHRDIRTLRFWLKGEDPRLIKRPWLTCTSTPGWAALSCSNPRSFLAPTIPIPSDASAALATNYDKSLEYVAVRAGGLVSAIYHALLCAASSRFMSIPRFRVLSLSYHLSCALVLRSLRDC